MSNSCAVRGRGLTKYVADVVALDGVDLDVAAGQAHGAVGPNGAGKTTLFGLLLGLSVADRGSLEVLDRPARRGIAAPDDVDNAAGRRDCEALVVRGDAPNPLWEFDGLVDLLATTSKG
jgi:ABC-type branched-subunit amino acid transport system ATPase component